MGVQKKELINELGYTDRQLEALRRNKTPKFFIFTCPKCNREVHIDKIEDECVWAVCNCGYKVIQKVSPTDFISKNLQGISWTK